MATKPIVQPELWASNAVYTTGPFIGSPGKVVPGGPVAAEGHRPGSAFPTPAEYENSQQNRITDLVRWVFLGSSAGAADAHIVETDTSGRATVHGATVDDSADEVALQVFGSGAAVPAVEIENTGGGGGVTVDIGNASAIGILANAGSGLISEGLRVVMAATPIGGTGVRINTDAATAAPALRVEHFGSGTGVQVSMVGNGIAGTFDATGGTGLAMTVFGNPSNTAATMTGGAGQAALQATSGNNAAAAVAALGAGSAIGLAGQGGNGSSAATGVEGSAVHVDARGVHGRTSVGAGTGVGVYGEGRGAGQIGVHAVSQTGIALLAEGDTTSPTHPPIRIMPQNADPSASTTSGNVTWRDSVGYRQIRHCVAGFGYKSVMSFGPGSALYAKAVQAFNTNVTFNNAGYTTVLTASALDAQGNGFASTSSGHQVLIRFTADVRTGTIANDHVYVRFIDMTGGGAGVTICTWTGTGVTPTSGFTLYATNGWQRTIFAEVMFPPSSDGDLIIAVAMSCATNPQFVRNGVLEIIGTF